ncbi:U32 family peptidase [Leptolyngbya sp. FACHB-8]|uniref:U32 family peptidase n=1 Tax=unclassified Leptolyngbya TaxID=2650499 RepID=UPI001686785B|nr:U32 family peptidase [Leptolyngbya sp. FACHB-8]MBD1912877.1 U32 family peptidase [Leptolyngbya sp. FACHB-8]
MDSASVLPLEHSRTFQRPELLAPAGNWECAKAAVENGADAIYFGLDRFNARMRAQNFTEADLPDLMAFLHLRGVKGYVTVNTLVFPAELPEAEQYLRSIITAGVDAIIVQDVGICRLIRHLSPDFPIHASTQMTVTSSAGVEFAKSLGCNLVVLARECSLKEIHKIQSQVAETGATLPLEVFVHGALCVAYSGQCLTSESLGGRSANRGECAQACRMPYELIADGKTVALGDRQYLLSPQDLAGLAVLPDLVKAGVHSLKIEGRLKAPEYVANVTRVYRQALDRAMVDLPVQEPSDRYDLEMAFSRGLYTGWFEGINNQELVHARFGKKRGVYLGDVTRIQGDRITIRQQAPLKPGDGVVFDAGKPADREEGGRVYSVEHHGKDTILTFGRRDLDWRRVQVGDRLWKTSDPELDKHLRQTYAGDTPQFQRPIWMEVHGEVGMPLVAIARDEIGHVAQVESEMPLVEAEKQPLGGDRLTAQFGRLGGTPFRLETLTTHLHGNVMLPVSEMNRMRRDLVSQMENLRRQPKRWALNADASYRQLMPPMAPAVVAQKPELIVLVRNLAQLDAALQAGIETLYCEFEDPRRYREAMQRVREFRGESATPKLFVAPPRITKPGENWILDQVRSSQADGYLVRNYDQLRYFADAPCVGDFPLNVANPITASHFHNLGIPRLTASYDLNIHQLENLLTACPPSWLEVTIHQHMPMFHMEHCVFCAFLSEGTDFTNCGRPCEQHDVKLRDRTNTEHILQADAGCRNTVFNGVAQTGAEYVQRLLQLGLRHFRIEFLNESPEQVGRAIALYHQLLNSEISGAQLWKTLKLQNQLGVTRGPMGV